MPVRFFTNLQYRTKLVKRFISIQFGVKINRFGTVFYLSVRIFSSVWFFLRPVLSSNINSTFISIMQYHINHKIHSFIIQYKLIFKTHPFISHIIFLVSGRDHLTCANLTSGHILGLSARLSPSLTSSHSHIYISLGSYTSGSACPSHISSFSHVTTTGTIRPAQFQISHQ